MVYCPNCGAESPDEKRYCADCGGDLAPPESSPQPYDHTSLRRPYRLRVNVLCLAGAVLAVLALFLPWGIMQTEGADTWTNAGAYDFGETNEGDHSYPSNFRYSVTLFLIGTILAFLTPIGGVLQFTGSLGFMLTASTIALEGTDLKFWIGATVGLSSSLMVLLSLAVSIGVGYETEKPNAMSRLFTIILYR